MAANFAYLNTRDLEFIVQEWLPTEEIFAYPKFADYYSKDDVKSILDPILKMCKEVIEPTNNDGEENPVKFDNGKVICTPSFGPLFHQLQEEGYSKMTMGKGEPFQNFMKEMYDFYEANKDNETLKQEFEVFVKAFKAMNKALQTM